MSNKVALITGGARIGGAVAQTLAERGFHIVMTYRSSRSAVHQTLREVSRRGRDSLAVRADGRSPKTLDALFRAVEQRFGRLDVLVNMISLYEKTPLADLLSPAKARKTFQTQIGTDLESAYALSLRAAPLMRRRGGGRIVHFSDWVAASGRPRYRDYLPYYTAKSAIKGLTEALALELAPDILVNAIAPGPILPPPDLSPAEKKAVEKSTPLGRWGGAGEIARTVLFFVETQFVTGECLRVDGGRHLL